MDTVELLSKFADPEVMKTLSVSQRLFAGLITTILGMGITFVSLVVLQFVIGLMARLTDKDTRVIEPEKTHAQVANPNEDEEIVAAITTALALQLKTSVSNIVIKNIEKVEDSTPAWHRAGITEHMHNSL